MKSAIRIAGTLCLATRRRREYGERSGSPRVVAPNRPGVARGKLTAFAVQLQNGKLIGKPRKIRN